MKKNCDTCRIKQYGYLCDGCIHDPDAIDKYEPMTNAERIRAMSDEELAKYLMDAHDCKLHIPFCQDKDECMEALPDIPEEHCMACMMAWLKQPAEVEK